MDLYLIFGFCLNVGLSTALTASYTGPPYFPLNSNATLKCQAAPVPEPVTSFFTFWYKVAADDVPKKFAVSTSNPNTSYVYTDAPADLRDRFIMSSAEFGVGTAKATLLNVQVADEGQYECEVENTADRATGRKRFALKVYSIPTVSIQAIESLFDIRPQVPTEAPENPEETETETPTGEEIPTGDEVPAGEDTITGDAATGGEGDTVIESTEAPVTTTTPAAPEPTSVATCFANFAYPKPAVVNFTGYTDTSSISLGDIPVSESIQNVDGTYNISATLSLNITKDLDQVRISCSVDINHMPANSDTTTDPYTVLYEADSVHVQFSTNMPTVGDDLTVDCKANGNPTPTATLLIPSGETVSVPHRFRVEKSHAGSYTCQVPESGDDIYDTRTLTVHWTERPTFTGGDGDRTVNLGDTVEVNCHAKGNPKPDYIWLKGGDQISTGKTLTFKNVHFTNAGEYTCQARGALTLTNSFKLVVESGCTVEFTKTVSASSEKENEARVELECGAQGNPPCQVTIYDSEGNALKTGPDSVDYIQESVPTQMEPLLYTCKGENRLNTTTKSVQLNDPIICCTEPSTGGLGAGVIIIIIILVALVIVGVPLAWYCIKKNKSPKAPPAEKDAESPAESDKLKPEENDGV